MSAKPLMRPAFAALIILLLQTAFLASLVESRVAILRDGTDIVLKTRPVDPRDLLRGDYVVLAYDISSIPLQSLTGERPTEATEAPLFVRLEAGADGVSAVTEASFQALAARPGSVVARSLPVFYDGQSDALQVAYGIERYYVPEGEGLALEEARNANAMTVTARVDEDGRMQIRLTAVDGKPLYEEPLY